MLDTSVFVSALEFASHAAATKDVRFYLSGTLFEFRPTGLELIATDRHRMAHVAVDFEAGNLFADLIVPNASVKTLLTLLKRTEAKSASRLSKAPYTLPGPGRPSPLRLSTASSRTGAALSRSGRRPRKAAG